MRPMLNFVIDAFVKNSCSICKDMNGCDGNMIQYNNYGTNYSEIL